MVGNGTAPVIVTAAGTNGQVLIAATGAAPAFASLTSTGGTVTFTPGAHSLNLEASGGGGVVAPIVTTFTNSGTWTKGANTSYVSVYMWNGGSGGASGSTGTDGNATGGGGGGAGASLFYSAAPNFFGATETVTIGAGGAGGAGQSTIDSPGNNGSDGGITRLGNLFVPQLSNGGSDGTYGQGNGVGGSAAPILNFVDQNVTLLGAFDGGSGSTGAGNPPAGDVSSQNNFSPTVLTVNGMAAAAGGGGSGANIASPQPGGNGGNILGFFGGSVIVAGGAGGIAGGTINGGNGNTGLYTSGGRINGGSGGAGGGGNGIGNGGSGGHGGLPAGAGGGGGAAIDGFTSGAGGNGASGLVIIVEYQ
jgi:hypothetical protein